MSNRTQPQSDSHARFATLLADAGAITREQAEAAKPPAQEPTMHALRRILGDMVLAIFPEGFPALVDEFFKLHSKNPAAWAELVNESEQERDDLLSLMRAYAECASETGYTIRQDRSTPGTVLRFRVIPRKGSKSTSEVEAEGNATSPDATDAIVPAP